jgi:hypothetical protein
MATTRKPPTTPPPTPRHRAGDGKFKTPPASRPPKKAARKAQDELGPDPGDDGAGAPITGGPLADLCD